MVSALWRASVGAKTNGFFYAQFFAFRLLLLSCCVGENGEVWGCSVVMIIGGGWSVNVRSTLTARLVLDVLNVGVRVR